MATLEQEIKQGKFLNEMVKANINVLFTANWLHNKISSRLKPFEVTHEQYNVLRILKGSHPKSMCQKDILSRMIAPNSNVTLIVKKLQNKALIHIQQSAIDRREYQIRITTKGLTLLQDIEKEFKNNNDMLGKLSTSEAFHLNALLEKLRSD